MRVKVTPKEGKAFHLEWASGRVVADTDKAVAKACAKYLSGKPTVSMSQANEGGTDSHWTEERKLETENDFFLTAGSLVDRVAGILRVDLVE